MTTRLDQALDVLHAFSSSVAKATRRRRRIRREHIETAVNAVSALASAVAVVVPQARPAAMAMGSLQKAAPSIIREREQPQLHIPRPELDLLARLQSLEAQIPTTTGEHRLRLEAQRDMLLKLVEDHEPYR